jgi:hypothetical protein
VCGAYFHWTSTPNCVSTARTSRWDWGGRLDDGVNLQIGKVEFRFADPDQQLAVQIKRRTLVEWWERAEHISADVFTANAIISCRDLCATTALARGNFKPDLIQGWGETYLNSQQQTPLPFVLPYLIDLGAIIAFGQPRLRPLGQARGRVDENSVRYQYYKVYQHDHLCMLAHHPASKFVRACVAAATLDKSTLRDIVLRFAYNIFSWVANTWFEVDCGGNWEQVKQAREHCAQGTRALTNPADVQAFLIQLGEAMRQARLVTRLNDPKKFREVIDPVERFLLGARPRVKDAFWTIDTSLVSECLESQPLIEREHVFEPIERLPTFPDVPSKNPGDRSTIDRIRKTNRLEQIAEVIPQEMAILRADDGRHLMLNKLMHDGLLIWQRFNYDAEVRRRRYLICFVLDIGLLSKGDNVADRGDVLFDGVRAEAGGKAHKARRNSPNVHGRRLIFEMLCDMAQFVCLPDATVDIHVFLEPLHEPKRRRLGGRTTLDELRNLLGKNKYNDMVEIETKINGFFFDSPGGSAWEHHTEFIRQEMEKNDYDFTLFVFLASQESLADLLPYAPPPPRNMPGLKDVVRLVQLGRSPTWVEVAAAASFDEAAVRPHFEVKSDEELRYVVLEDLLGPRRLVDLDEPDIGFEN